MFFIIMEHAPSGQNVILGFETEAELNAATAVRKAVGSVQFLCLYDDLVLRIDEEVCEVLGLPRSLISSPMPDQGD